MTLRRDQVSVPLPVLNLLFGCFWLQEFGNCQTNYVLELAQALSLSREFSGSKGQAAFPVESAH